jgi:hypothetical protein
MATEKPARIPTDAPGPGQNPRVVLGLDKEQAERLAELAFDPAYKALLDENDALRAALADIPASPASAHTAALDDLRALSEAATPGPWKGNDTVIWRDGDAALDDAIGRGDPKAGPIIASEHDQTGLSKPSRFVGSTYGDRPVRGANSRLIVAAVNYVRAALAAPAAPRVAGRCGCNCLCHADEGKPEWPGPCAGCCEPGMNCDCGRALADPAAPLDVERLARALVERVHDIVEWLGTDIEGEMDGENPTYRRWIDATVEAHMLLSGCRNHPQAARLAAVPHTHPPLRFMGCAGCIATGDAAIADIGDAAAPAPSDEP